MGGWIGVGRVDKGDEKESLSCCRCCNDVEEEISVDQKKECVDGS